MKTVRKRKRDSDEKVTVRSVVKPLLFIAPFMLGILVFTLYPFINAVLISFKEDYRVLNSEIRAMGYNIPPLVNAYMNLSPTMKLVGTAINYGFGDVEETGMLIAVDEILEDKRVRHIDSYIKEHPEAMQITSGYNKVIYKEKQ